LRGNADVDRRSSTARPSVVISVAGLNPSSVEPLGGAGAVLRGVAAHLGGRLLDQEQADAGASPSAPDSARRHDEGVGLVTGRHHGLAAVTV
jgi:hypothetical protein